MPRRAHHALNRVGVGDVGDEGQRPAAFEDNVTGDLLA